MTDYEQLEQGAILTTGGAITTGVAVASLAWKQMPAWGTVLGGISGIAAAVGAMLSLQKM